MENNDYRQNAEKSTVNSSADEKQIVIPVVEEYLTVDKEVVETGKVRVATRVSEEEVTVNLPVVSEQYEVRHVPVDKVFPTAPPVRYEGDTLIVPVIEEVVVVEKRYRVVEEVHLVKRTTETPFMQQITLQKQEVNVERVTPEGKKTKL